MISNCAYAASGELEAVSEQTVAERRVDVAGITSLGRPRSWGR